MTIVESTIEGPAEVDRLARMLSLTGQEARRSARHPVLWLVPAATAATAIVEAPGVARPTQFWYLNIFLMVSLLAPVVAIFVANMVASGARRARAEEVLSVAPAPDTERTLALCLGVALTLGSIGVGGVVVMSLIAAIGQANGQLDTSSIQTAGELAQIPPILVGAGLLGVLTARWLRFPGAALVTFVVFVVVGGIVFKSIGIETGTRWFWWSTSTPMGEFLYEGPELAGDPWWHAAYLVGLCACATVASVYRDRGQWAKLVGVGLPVAAATVAVGLLQLP